MQTEGGEHTGATSRGGAMAGVAGVHRYGVPVRYSMNGEHEENEQLTVRSKEKIAASEKAPKARVNDGNIWREKKGCG